jgi:hypothetical protein
MSELCGNSVIIEWSNERREHVVTQYGAEIGAAFRTNDARAIAHNYRVERGYVSGLDFSRDPRDL